MIRTYVDELQNETWEDAPIDTYIRKLRPWLTRCQELREEKGGKVDTSKLPRWAQANTKHLSAYLTASQTPAVRDAIEALYRAYADRWAPILIRACRGYSTEPDDLIGAMYDHFCRALSGYDPERGELDAYLYYVLKRNLRRHAEYAHTETRSLDEMKEETGYEPQADKAQHTDYRQWCAEISGEAAQLYDLLTAV
mgnify:CR=1 FL=1